MSLRPRSIVILASVLVLACLALAQVLVPSPLHNRVRREVLRYVPSSVQKRTRIESSVPFPAIVVLFGDIGAVSVQTPELKVSQRTDIFSLIGEASSLNIRAQQLTTPIIVLKNVLLQSHDGAFLFQGFVSRAVIGTILPTEFRPEGVSDGGILLHTETGPVALRLFVSDNGSKVTAALANKGLAVPPVFTILEDPHMHVSSAVFQSQAEGWIVVVRGHTS